MSDLISVLSAAAGQGGEATDEYFQNTTLLLHGDGTNGAQNNTFLDSSTNNFTITRNGNTTQGTFTPFSKPDGSWGNYFNGSAYLSVSNAAMAMGTGDFSVIFYVYRTTSDGKYLIGTSNTTGSWAVYSANGTSISVRINNLASDLIAGTLVANTWNKVEVTRTSGTLYLYVDDVLQASTANTTNFTQSNLGIGSFGQTTTFAFTGYFSNVKIIKAGTEVLNTCRSNRFLDTSPSPLTVTSTSVVTTPFSPFPLTTAYTPSINDGSGYFDGSGDYLLGPSGNVNVVLGASFTVEAWVYPTSHGGVFTLNGTSTGGWAQSSINGFSLQTTVAYIGYSPTPFTTVDFTDLPLNAWSHIAFVKNGSSGTNLTVYVNGVSIATGSYTTTTTIGDGTDRFGIGFFDNFSGNIRSPLTGYISNLRVTNSAVYTSGFSVPTAPLPAITGTEILLDSTNAGIFDNTGFNNLETVADAQIDTTTKKYGTGSIEFDGTGDWLKIPDSPDLKLGTGKFTIEFWVYLASGDTGSNRGLVGKGGASTGWLVSLNTTEKVVFTYASSTITSSGAITTNAWNHIAVVREGTGSNETKIYIGGTNDGTGTVSTDFTQTEVMYIGANRTAGDPMKGFVDDLRITKGIARYTTTFTPPTAAFPNIGE